MVIDTSAILFWLKNEPERERIGAALEAYPITRLSAASPLAHIVVRAREHPAMVDKLQGFLEDEKFSGKAARPANPTTACTPRN